MLPNTPLKKREVIVANQPTLNELGGSNFTFDFMAKNGIHEERPPRQQIRGMRSSSHGFQEDSNRTISTIHHPETIREKRPPKPRQIFEQDPFEVNLVESTYL